MISGVGSAVHEPYGECAIFLKTLRSLILFA